MAMYHVRRAGAVVALFLMLTTVDAGQDGPKGKDKKKDDVPDGLKALKHEDPLVRYRAAAILGRLPANAKFAVPALREALHDKDGRVRVKVAESLWKIEKTPPNVLLPVLEGALKDKDAAVRILAPGVLGQLGTKAKTALPTLFAALKDPDIDVRIEVILALGELGPVAVDAVPLLLNLSKHEDFPL